MDNVLLCSVASRRCAVPLACVIETMRPQPLVPLADAPPFVLGVSLVRGEPVPVVDVAALLGGTGSPTRLVTVRTGSRTVALALDGVDGVAKLDPGALRALPPLFGPACADRLRAVGALDGELLVVLEAAHLLPEAP